MFVTETDGGLATSMMGMEHEEGDENRLLELKYQVYRNNSS